MSGGHYEYAYMKLEDFADQLELEGGCPGYCASPEVREKFRELVKLVARAMHAIEWNDSGDGNPNEEKLIRACFERVL